MLWISLTYEKEDSNSSKAFERVITESSATTSKAQKSVEGWIVLVTNLNEELSEEDLIEKFSDYGQIKNIHLNLDRRTGYVKGYALIEYLEYSQAKAAITAWDGLDLMGKVI